MTVSRAEATGPFELRPRLPPPLLPRLPPLRLALLRRAVGVEPFPDRFVAVGVRFVAAAARLGRRPDDRAPLLDDFVRPPDDFVRPLDGVPPDDLREFCLV